MKKLSWIVCLVSSVAAAQNVDYDEVVVLRNTNQISFEEKLVYLAWNNDPESDVIRRNVDLARYNVKLSALEWLNIFSVQGNLNEFNINHERDVNNRSQFYPRYNLAARISLGMLFTIPYSTRRSREEVYIAQSLVNDRKLAIRAQVLKLYNDYLLQEKIYKLEAEMSLEAENTHKLAEEKFKNGEITFEEYSVTRAVYTEARIAFFQAETAFKNAKLSLEELIGVPLEEVE